jgi:hypothetical protein
MTTIDTGTLNKVANTNARRTSHITSFTVHAQLQGLFIGILILLAQIVSVRSHLTRAREIEIYWNHRTIHCTDGTFDALVKLLLYAFLLLLLHDSTV